MAKKKQSVTGSMAIGTSIGAVAGAAVGAAAAAMANKTIRDKTVKTAKRVTSKATKTLAKAGKNVPLYGEKSYGTAGGSTARKKTTTATKPTKSTKKTK